MLSENPLVQVHSNSRLVILLDSSSQQVCQRCLPILSANVTAVIAGTGAILGCRSCSCQRTLQVHLNVTSI